MIKKLILLVFLAGVGYVGYLVWTEYLSESDKAKVKHKLDQVGSTVKKGAKKVAKKAAHGIKDALDDDQKTEPAGKDPDEETKPEQDAEDREGAEPPPLPDLPGKPTP